MPKSLDEKFATVIEKNTFYFFTPLFEERYEGYLNSLRETLLVRMLEEYINTITQGDCLELLRQIPDDSIDVTFADPPFNLGKRYTAISDNLALQEYLDWCERWIREMFRITKPSGSIFVHNILKWLTYYATFLNKIAHFKHWISWDAPTSPMGKTLQPAHYGILFYLKDSRYTKFYEIRYPHKRCRKCGYLHKDYGGKKALLHPFGPLVSDVWTDIHRVKHNKYRDEHPCQLPIHLLERIILMSTDEGDIVLDPFSGTGTTAIAAKRLGRRYIGFELSDEYIHASRLKLEQEQADSKIGDAWVSFFLDEIVTLRDIDWPEIAKYYIILSPNRWRILIIRRLFRAMAGQPFTPLRETGSNRLCPCLKRFESASDIGSEKVNSRERVLLALNHREPDRVPIDFAGTGVSTICFQAYDDLRAYLGLEPRPFDPDNLGGATWAGVVVPHPDVYDRLHSDVQLVGMGDPDAWQLKIEYGDQFDTYVDEWGTRVYRPKGGHYFDYREFPIQEASVEAVRAWSRWPDPLDAGRWRGFRQRCLDAQKTGRAITAFSVFGGGIFEQPARIMPMDEYFMGIVSDPQFADAILGKMFDIYYEATVKMLEEVGDVLDVWVYWDDLSGQNGPLISPAWYERHLMPLHRRLFDKVKSMSEAKIFFHCCGAARPWIPYLIDVGVDILNPVQVSAAGMDPVGLKRDFGRDIVFWGGACNPQGALAFGTPEEVAAEVKHNIDALAPGGGFVFANVHNIQNKVPPQNIVAMFDTCYEYGRY